MYCILQMRFVITLRLNTIETSNKVSRVDEFLKLLDSQILPWIMFDLS